MKSNPINIRKAIHPSSKVILSITFTVLFTIFLSSPVFADYGRSLPGYWPQTEIYEELQLRGEIPLNHNVWPPRTAEVSSALSEIPEGERWSDELRYFLENRIVPEDTFLFIAEPGTDGILNNPRDPDDRFYGLLRLGGGMDLGRLEFFTTYMVNTRWAREENYRGRQWEGFAGRPDQVYIAAGDENWGLAFGRDYISWGEGLVLGRGHDPFERLDYEFQFGPFDFRGFVGFLDSRVYYEWFSPDSGVKHIQNRYLSGHRLEYVSPHFTIALYENIIYGGEYRNLEVVYAVPFYWFHAEQLNSGKNDNTIIGGDLQLLFSPIRFSLDFMVDDIQVEAERQADEEPPEIGLVLQLDLATSPFGKWTTFTARYEGITNRTYNQTYPHNKYLLMDQPLGSELGNDVDRTSLSARSYLSPLAIIGAELFYLRDGEGEISDEWTEPWMEMEGNYVEPFPSGIVEKTAGVILSWKGYIGDRANWKLEWEYGQKRDADHVRGAEKDYWQLGLRAQYAFTPGITF